VVPVSIIKVTPIIGTTAAAICRFRGFLIVADIIFGWAIVHVQIV
jgi:hypothetical protein